MRTLLPLILTAAWFYVALRFVYFLPDGAAVRIGVALLLLLVARYHALTRRYFGSFGSPELPRAVLLVLAWAFGAFMLLFVLLLLRDIVGALVFAAAPQAGRSVLLDASVAWAIGVLAGLLSLVGVWQGVKVPHVKTVEVALAGLPRAFDGYRIVQLTDTHVSRLLPARWAAAVVAKANALAPDLIVVTGDLADGTPEVRARDVAPLADLRAPDGVLAIAGNHEYYSGYQPWMRAYHSLGVRVLENAHLAIARDAETLVIAGLTDRQAASYGEPRPDLQTALAGVTRGAPVILLDHRPGNAVRNASAGIGLQISGHTHGGQILGLHLLARRSNSGFVSGMYRVGGMHLYVSNGTGLWSGLALRLGRPSEITRLVLRRAAG